MKQENYNEMDVLLRRLSRRESGDARDAESVDLNSIHLDADELNAFAENALPASARARYTEHLGECSSCRKLVVQLSSAAGVVAHQPEVVPTVEASWLKKFFSSLLSPLTLRYAIPVVAAIGFLGLGYLVIQQKSAQKDSLAQSDVANVKQAASPAAASEPGQSPGFNDQQSTEGRVAQDSKRPAEVAKTTAPAEKDSEEVVASNERAAAAPPAAPVAVDQVSVATPSPSGKLLGDADSVTRNEAEVKKNDVAAKRKGADDEIASSDRPAKESTKEPAKQLAKSEARRDTPAPTSVGGATKAESSPYVNQGLTPGVSSAGVRGRQNQKDKDKDSQETRTVEGHQFRKQGNVWVDSAYSSYTSTTNLTRGSEQYRALVADEPSIRTIADQLSGEVVVVWKGRAYRIR